MRRRVLVASLVTSVCVAITPGQRTLSGQRLSDDERRIQSRRQLQNGIVVGEPKLYDDALLRQMLSAAQAKLASLQLLDQAAIASKVGVLTGADQRVNSGALTLQTPSLPQVKTTEKGPTTQTVQKESENLNADDKPTGGTRSTDVTSNQSVTDVETTRAAFAPPSPTAALASTTLPTGFSVSASDLLNEQMQLTFEIANLRLMLDGALSDRRFSKQEKLNAVKPRRTIGIPIAIDPERRFKDAAAIVEVEIKSLKALAARAKPSITALLPQEKTYNVAAIRESNTSIGGGVVTQVVGIGGNWYQGRKTYYIVKDQDTLAQFFTPEDSKTRVGVSWQFRPVLGQEYVRPRQTQTFVQMAFPNSFTADKYASLTIRSYWCRYDRKHGAIKEMIPGSLKVQLTDWQVPAFDSQIVIPSFNDTHLEDLGNGQMLFRVLTPLLTGTSLRIGSTVVKEGPGGPLVSDAGVTFVAPLSDLATKQTSLVGRDNEETELVIERHLASGAEPAPVITAAKATPVDETMSLLEVELVQLSTLKPEQVLVIGGKVIGYSDEPIERQGKTLSAVVPTALLQAHPRVEVTALFAPRYYRDTAEIKGVPPRSGADRLVAFDETATHKTFLLHSRRLTQATISVPASAKLTEFRVDPAKPETVVDKETLAIVTIDKNALVGREHIVLQRPNERPVLVALPPATPPKKPAPIARERVVVGFDQAVFDSEGLANLSAITFDGKPLKAKVAKDNKSVTVTGLAAAGVTARAGTLTLDFVFGETKITAKLEVISARLETLTGVK